MALITNHHPKNHCWLILCLYYQYSEKNRTSSIREPVRNSSRKRREIREGISIMAALAPLASLCLSLHDTAYLESCHTFIRFLLSLFFFTTFFLGSGAFSFSSFIICISFSFFFFLVSVQEKIYKIRIWSNRKNFKPFHYQNVTKPAS